MTVERARRAILGVQRRKSGTRTNFRKFEHVPDFPDFAGYRRWTPPGAMALATSPGMSRESPLAGAPPPGIGQVEGSERSGRGLGLKKRNIFMPFLPFPIPPSIKNAREFY